MRTFKLSISKSEIVKYLYNQVAILFPDKQESITDLNVFVANALERIEVCFKHIKGKHYTDDFHTYFNHLHGDQYCTFLYLVSNEAYEAGNLSYYQKISLLNKQFFSIDLYGHIEMPEIFLLVHPLGSIFGRAKYSNYFIAYQGVTVGGVHKGDTIEYPNFEEEVICYANCTILGNATFGKNISIGANTNIVGGNYEPNKTIVGSFPNLRVLDSDKSIKSQFFNSKI